MPPRQAGMPMLAIAKVAGDDGYGRQEDDLSLALWGPGLLKGSLRGAVGRATFVPLWLALRGA
jgi:hypothetical protein